jgi:EAL domain-containing protein (putative c-di-GMP-specific phosphodiesterase class I)
MSLNLGAKAVAELAAKIEHDGRELGSIDPESIRRLAGVLERTLAALAEGEAPVAAAAAPPVQDDPDEAMLAELAGAAERGEFSLVYQRQVGRDGVTLTGVESLLRWESPKLGIVSPAVFIPLAERHNRIRPITLWVLQKVMEDTAGLGVPVGFNASAIEFADPHFVDDIADLIAHRRFDPAALEIEITETAILKDGEEVRRNIERLHKLGVKIALDDFGVGYSSLSHLRMFPFDKLKIDRAFVTDCSADVQSATVVHAVISIGRALGMKVVAEGVETEEQAKFLKIAGVHAMQGYLFKRPEKIEDLRAALTPAGGAVQAAG